LVLQLDVKGRIAKRFEGDEEGVFGTWGELLPFDQGGG
jgi:hypothetical protein